jgi:primase-polymerase (primpol)-like protein
MYGCGRYFTITGEHLAGTPYVIEQRQPEVNAILSEHFRATPRKAQHNQRAPYIENQSDAEVIRRAFSARSGTRFRKLWAGDTSDYEGDHSRADAALCRMLSYWTGGDAMHIDRLFRMSGLMRDKWNRKTGEETYGARTIRLSLQR